MTPYKVGIRQGAGKQLAKLPSPVQDACVRLILSLADDPRPHGCAKIKGTADGWRLVVREDYRILYVIDDAARSVTVYWIGRREKDIYRPA